MPPIYWIVGLVLFSFLFWQVLKNNGKRGKPRRRAHAAKLAQENYRLRHVLAQLSVENYALKSAPHDRW